MEDKEYKRLVITLKLTKDEYDFLKKEAKEQTRSESAQILHLLRKSLSQIMVNQ